MSHLPPEADLYNLQLLPPRRDSSQSISELTQFLLRGSNTLTETERELIATLVPDGSQGLFSTSEKMQALLSIAAAIRAGRKQVTRELTDQAIRAGATVVEIHDTILLAVLFV